MGSSRAIAVLVVAALAAPAGAQPNPDAAKLFEEGRELQKNQKWAEACDRFQKSLALDPAPGTKLNLGECLEKQGLVRKGWLMFEEAARDFERVGDGRAKFAHERAGQAAAKLATIVIKVADPKLAGLAIHLGDRVATPQAEIVERVDPGSLLVVAAAPGRETFTKSLDLTGGRTVVVDVPALAAAPADVPVHDTAAAGPDPRRHQRMVIAFTLGGVGALSLLSSLGVGLYANKLYDDQFSKGDCLKTPDGPLCNPEGKTHVDEAATYANVGTVLAVAGVGLGVAAVIVYVTAPKERGVTVTPTATSSTVGLSLNGRF